MRDARSSPKFAADLRSGIDRYASHAVA